MGQPEIQPRKEPQDLLPFERLLAEISTFFINLPADRIGNEIVAAQKRICELLDLDRAALLLTAQEEPGILLLTHVHQPPGSPPPPDRLNATDLYPWAVPKLLKGETVVISRMTELPAEACRDRDSFDLFGTKSAVYVPLSTGAGPVFGVLAFVVTRGERDWPERVVQQFQLVAQIFANALARQHAEKSIEERLQFEMLLADISARFVNLPSGRIDGAIEDAQRHVCECLGLDLSALWQWSVDAPGLLTMTHIYRAAEGPPLPEPMNAQDYFPWCRRQLEQGKIVSVSSMADLPAEAIRDRETWRHYGIKTSLTLPMSVGDGPPIGALSFNTVRTERAWPEAIVKRLQLVSQVFTNALARKRAELELVKSEQRLRLITNALPVLIAHVDSGQRYRFNNDAYRKWFGISPEDAFGRTIREVIGEEFYQSAKSYIERALSGEHVRCSLDVETAEGRPLAVEAIYVPDVNEQADVCGFYVLVIDVTDRNRAQKEAKRLEDELLHAGRISALGELAGALAHEINQPLSAIMSNAQAAKRFLETPAPDLKEVKEILDDIAAEDARASEVINRLRSLLKNTPPAFEQLDLNLILSEVAGFVNSNAAMREVAISMELAPGLPAVHGDRIQLQQVALNLLINAFDAVSENPSGGGRQVFVRTWSEDSAVHASVADNGSGISAGDIETVFTPFFTTKSQGLGMGLSISRSIIIRHDGRIWVENNTPGQGATFHIRLPAAVKAPERV
jgi:PAS domain S-box-containing protein